MAFNDMPDSRPVNVGDLVAAKWYPDTDWYIGVVDYNYLVAGLGSSGEVNNAHHVVKLMDADEWRRLIDDMEQAPFYKLAEKFPMITTGDFDPMATMQFGEAIKEAALQWLNWNYPKD